MCTYEPRRDLILRALDAVIAQVHTVDLLEIVVVDNNSSPGLDELGYLDDYPIRLIREPRQGLTAARERAIAEANGDVIVFVDDDNVLDDGYLATVVESFAADPRLSVLGGCVLPEYEAPPPRWFLGFEEYVGLRRYDSELHVETTNVPYSQHFPIGAGMAVRHDLALAWVRHSNETSRIEDRRGDVLSAGADTDLSLFALFMREKLAVSGALRLTHVIPRWRVDARYLARLVVGTVESSFALERKWAVQFGQTIFPMVSSCLIGIVAKTAAAFVLIPASPHYWVRYRALAKLARLRIRVIVKSGWGGC